MLDIMEERKTSVLRVLTDISEAKSLSDGEAIRSFNELHDSPQPSYEELRTVQQTKKLLQKKNQLHPLFANHPYRCASMYGGRASSSRPNQKLKDISQRIVSAKLIQIKELRNQLTLIQHQLNEVTNENRFLKTLQKRQEVALRKYEGHEARLPQLIQSHNEEVRALTSKMKQLKHTNQRLMEKLKSAEQQLSSLQEQHCHLVELSRNNQLGEREDLANRVEELEHTVCQQNNTIQLLNRKVDLERKNYKHELGLEKSKRGEVENKLSLAMQTIENLKDQIEAKEKCMNAIVPSRYVRTSHGLGINAVPTARMTHSHSQIPRTPRNQNSLSALKNNMNHNQTLRRSSTDNTGDETDMTESRNGHNTSDSTRTVSNTTLPKIKPQLSNRNMRNQYKLSSKRLVNKESTTNGSPDYSSSFASEDMRKNSESGSDKLPPSKSHSTLNSRKNSSRSRKFSVDSGVMNRSESGKITQRTGDSRASSSKTRRNSISVCRTSFEDPGEMNEFLHQESLAAKIETHKSIRDELRELEEKLLRGSKFLEKSKKQKSVDQEAEDTAREMSKGLMDTPRNGYEDGSGDEENGKYDNVNWSEIHNKIKAESKAAEAKLEEYYNTLEKSELNFEETENYIALEEEQKSRLLKALQEIDKEAQGVSSGSSGDEVSPSSSRPLARRRSDGFKYNFSKNVDNLHKGRPVYDNVKVPAVEKMKREEKEYLSDIESGRKNKAELMKELFGNFDGKEDNLPANKRQQSEDLERLVELDRAID